MNEEQDFTIEITSLGSHGEGVGHLADGYTVFIDGALPQETVQARLSKKHKRYGVANLLAVLKPSPHRVEPACSLFDRCGGCQLMHLSYAEQLKIKQQRVIDALQRIGKLVAVEVLPCIPSPQTHAYRNKIQVPVKEGLGKCDLSIGLYARSSHQLVEVSSCPIHCSLGDEIYQKIYQLVKTSGLKAYRPSDGQGELRHILIKTAVFNQQALVILVTSSEDRSLTRPLAEKIMSECPAVKGVIQNVNNSQKNTILGTKFMTLLGSSSIQEQLGELLFNVSPASFFQVNPAQALQLYQKALELAELQGHEMVLDAFCGVGTLALFFAKRAKKVLGIECVGEAIVDARENAKLNQMTNVSFVCAKAESYIANLKAVNLVLLNPPRKGCEPALLNELGRLKPEKIIYISCDPSTLARDLAFLTKLGYALSTVQPFDMFPQTAHVECLALLQRTS